MKKKNLATAMAAAMMFGGVAPVVAHADEKAPVETNKDQVTPDKSQDIAQKENVVNVPLANGQKVEVMPYSEVYENNGTLDTKDDKLALNKDQEILYAEGMVGKTLNDTDAQYVVATKMTDEELKANEKDIKTNKTNYEDYLANIAALKNITYTKDGKTEKVYKETIENIAEKDADNKITGTKQTVTLTNVAPDLNDFAKEAKFVFNNVKMDSKLETPQVKLQTFTEILKDNADFPVVENTVTLDVAKKAGITGSKGLNKLAYELSKTYNSENTETKEVEKYNATTKTIDKTITVYEKGTKNVVGKIVLNGYDKFKETGFKYFVNISEIKDLNSLEQPELSWAKKDVMNSLYNAQLKGYEDNTIRLSNNVTRAEFAKMLVEMRDIKIDTKDAKQFSDVNKEDWFYNYVATLSKEGIVSGDGDGTFRPDDTITRQEAAVMLANAMNDKGTVDKFNANTGKHIDTTTDFKDDKSIATWADGSVKVMNDQKVINGYEDKTFRPENNITRAETIAMIQRSAGKTISTVEVESVK